MNLMQNMVADAVMVGIFIFAMVVLGYAFFANKLAFTSCRGAGAFSVKAESVEP